VRPSVMLCFKQQLFPSVIAACLSRRQLLQIHLSDESRAGFTLNERQADITLGEIAIQAVTSGECELTSICYAR